MRPSGSSAIGHSDLRPLFAASRARIAETTFSRTQARTQIVVTTHSRLLVDALSEDPTRLIVCEKQNGASQFQRLDAEALKEWLTRYSLGQLWSMGELGGNRW